MTSAGLEEPIDHMHRRPADRAALQAQARYAASQRPALSTPDPDDTPPAPPPAP